MTVSYKPDGYSTVSPYLIVDDAGTMIEFLTRVFGGVELRRFPGEGGLIAHAEVRIEDSVVMLADRAPDWPAAPSHVHVYVGDVDSVYHMALAAGASSVQEPTKKDDPDRRAGVRDAGGTTWWIGTRVE
jgi:PhnB protein